MWTRGPGIRGKSWGVSELTLVPDPQSHGGDARAGPSLNRHTKYLKDSINVSMALSILELCMLCISLCYRII